MTFVVITEWIVREGDQTEAAAALGDVADATRLLEGTKLYAVSLDREHGRRFVIYQEFVDRPAFERHHAADHITSPSLAAILNRLESRSRSYADRLH